MKQLTRYPLDYDITYDYVQDSFIDANKLSSELLKATDFKKGYFFTLLPEGSNIDRLYEFKDGIILPQNPTIEYKNSSGRTSSYTLIPMIRNELSVLIHNKIISQNNLRCILDDVTRNLNDYFKKDPRDDTIQPTISFYGKEIYYVLEKNNISLELILICLKSSNAFWHSLCVLTNADITPSQTEELSLKNFIDICQQTELVIVGAYDGEGYVFWEKQESFFP